MAMSIKGLLAEACRTPSKNPKLAFFLFILSLIPHLLLNFVIYVLFMLFFAKQVDEIMADIMAAAATQGADYEGLLQKMMAAAKGLMIFLVIISIISILIQVFQSIIVIHWVDTTHFQKQVAPKDFVSKVSKTWKGTLITILLIGVLWFCYLGASVFIIAIVLVVFNSSNLLGLSLVVISVLALALSIYGAVLSNLATVISVVEDGCYGFGAIDKAMKNIKGRRMQGCLLTLAIFGISFSVFFVYWILRAMLEKEGIFSWVLGLVWVSLGQMMAMFNMAVYTVFYRDCQKLHDQFAGLELHYDKVPTAD